MKKEKEFFKNNKLTKILSIIAGLYLAGILILQPTTITIMMGIIGGATLISSGIYMDSVKNKKVLEKVSKNIPDNVYLKENDLNSQYERQQTRTKDNFYSIDINKLGFGTNEIVSNKEEGKQLVRKR